jgi:hypothetical protein
VGESMAGHSAGRALWVRFPLPLQFLNKFPRAEAIKKNEQYLAYLQSLVAHRTNVYCFLYYKID